MSGKVVGAVFDLKIPIKPKMVLLKYADNADEEGRNAFPSVKTIAAKCSIPARTVRRIIVGLKHLGILELDGKGFGGRKEHARGQCYRINLPRARQIDEETWAAAYREANDWAKTLATSVDNVSEQQPGPLDDKRCPPMVPQTLSTNVDDKPSGTSIEPRARAAPSQAPALARGSPSGKKPAEATAPANAVWKEHHERIEAAVGKSWFSQLTPHSDDGKTLTLVAPSRMIADIVRRVHTECIGTIIERRIVIEVRAYAGPAARDRERRKAGADCSAP